MAPGLRKLLSGWLHKCYFVAYSASFRGTRKRVGCQQLVLNDKKGEGAANEERQKDAYVNGHHKRHIKLDNNETKQEVNKEGEPKPKEDPNQQFSQTKN
jgi:hypothetical protein